MPDKDSPFNTENSAQNAAADQSDDAKLAADSAAADAEVAKLAMQLEGPNSAIEAMLAAEPAVPAKAAKPANGAAGNTGASEGGGTLAERIRALQSHASRARQPG